jgi:hypothetical protein
MDDFGVIEDRGSVKSKINTKWMDKEISNFKLNDLDNKSFETYGQRQYLEERRKLEERKIKLQEDQLNFKKQGYDAK